MLIERTIASDSAEILHAEMNVLYTVTRNLVLSFADTVIPRLTKAIRSGITFVSRNVISRGFL